MMSVQRLLALLCLLPLASECSGVDRIASRSRYEESCGRSLIPQNGVKCCEEKQERAVGEALRVVRGLALQV